MLPFVVAPWNPHSADDNFPTPPTKAPSSQAHLLLTSIMTIDVIRERLFNSLLPKHKLNAFFQSLEQFSNDCRKLLRDCDCYA